MTKKLMKKLSVLFCAFFMVVNLSACSIMGFDARTLISPPQSNVDQQAIHSLLTKNAIDIDFVYPKSGDFRSAITIRDLNNDGSYEALGFFLSEESGINISFMNQKDGQWQLIANFTNLGTQVNKVVFGDMDSDGIEEIVIGWGSPQSLTATISIYKYDQNDILEYHLNNTYNEFMLADMDGDLNEELVTATVSIPAVEPETVGQDAVARIYSFDKSPILAQSCEINQTLAKYSSMTLSQIDNYEKAIILEGTLAEGGTITQILSMKNGILTAPLSQEDKISKYGYFTRPSVFNISATDINSDGVIEFPKVYPQIENSNFLESYNYYVDWVNLETRFYMDIRVRRSLVFTEDDFTFEIDPKRNIVCYGLGDGDYFINERIFSKEGVLLKDKNLFEIKVFEAQDWEKFVFKNSDNGNKYTKVLSLQNKVYAVTNYYGLNKLMIDTMQSISK